MINDLICNQECQRVVEMEGHYANGKKRRLSKNLEVEQSGLSSLISTMSSNLLHDYFRRFEELNDSTNGSSAAAVIFDNGKGKVEELTYQELDEGARLVASALHDIFSGGIGHDDGQEFVGVACDLGRLYPVLILGILRSGHAFYNVDQSNFDASVGDGVKHLGMKYILSSVPMIKIREACEFKEMKIPIKTDGKDWLSFRIIKIVGNSIGRKFSNENFAYAIQTSGTTGEKKTVLVPHKCICGNIDDFARLHWKLKPNDVVFGSAPPTFDPHIVELFSTLAAGGTILYTTPEVKLSGRLLASILDYHKVTILQITPSLFRRLFSTGHAMSSKMSSVRLIAFGGEKCPEKEELLEIKSKYLNENLTFQNVYGVTEVSCWASISNIDLLSSAPITLGTGLLNTEVSLSSESEGEILISSSIRYCVTIDSCSSSHLEISSKPPYQYHTGDLGLSTPHGIVFLGRKDRVVKRHGMKVSLNEIESASLATGLVSYTECKVLEGKIYLVVKLKSEFQSNCREEGVSLFPAALSNRLELPLFMYPDFIVSIDQNIPLNGNGKMDFNFIIKSLLYGSSSEKCIHLKVTRSQIIQTLAPVWKSCTHSSGSHSDLLEDLFISSGGTSISATRFVESAFMCLKLFGSELHRKWEQSLLHQLLDQEEGRFGGVVETIWKIISESPNALTANLASLDEILLPEKQEPLPPEILLLHPTFPEFEFYLMNDPNNDKDDFHVFCPIETFPDKSDIIIHSPPQPMEHYRFQFGLCVDASPALVPGKDQAIIGCHGGILLCIDLNVLRGQSRSPNQSIIWKRRFSNRIEAEVEIHPDALFAYVGCHDGNFYKFSVSTGVVSCWTCCGGVPIRSKSFASSDFVIFVDSANSIYCVDSHTLNIYWRLNSFKLLATINPVIFRRQTILTTLDSGIVSIDMKSGNVIWTTKVHSTDLIYSSPILVSLKEGRKQRSTLLICSSNQGIEARDPKNGKLLWNYSSSSHPVLEPLLNKCCNNLIFVESTDSSDMHLNILNLETGQALRSIRTGHSGPITSNLLYTNPDDVKECYLIFKSSEENVNSTKTTRPVFKFMSLHSSEASLDEISVQGQHDTVIRDSCDKHGDIIHWGMDIPDFETFSKPKICSEFVLFGGRDNQLHVIKLKVLKLGSIKK